MYSVHQHANTSAVFHQATAQRQQQHEQSELSCTPELSCAFSQGQHSFNKRCTPTTHTQLTHRHKAATNTAALAPQKQAPQLVCCGLTWNFPGTPISQHRGCKLPLSNILLLWQAGTEADCIAVTITSAALSVPATAGAPTGTEQSQYINNTASALSVSLSSRPH